MTTWPTRALAATLLLATSVGALAHHGWSWTTGGNISLTGIVRTAQLGNPHGVLTVDADGETWTVEVGQPWRNERAGLQDSDFSPGTEMTFEGEPSADLEDRLLKVERIILNGETHELYPGRD